MAGIEDELRALREEISTLRWTADRLTERLNALERQQRLQNLAPTAAPTPPPVKEPTPAPSEPEAETPPPAEPPAKPVAVPPPLPSRPSVPPPPARPAKPPKPQINWETWLGTVLIPRLGAFLLATAVVVGSSIAFQRMGPGGRVALGYLIAGALLAIGFWQERKYAQFGRILLGVGFALTYFVTYAAHYLPITQVISSPTVDWILLGLVALLWAGAAQWRNSYVMASFAMGLGHYTIFLSGPHKFSVAIVLFLALITAFFMLRNGWYTAGFVGLIGVYINHGLWMSVNEGGGWGGFWVAMLALWVYYLTFVAAERLAPRDTRPKHFAVRSAYAALNTAALVILGAVIMDGFPPVSEHGEGFLFTAAAVLLLIGFWYGKRDSAMMSVYVTKAASIAVLGFAVAFEGETFLAATALEAAVLMVAARRSGMIVSRLLSWALVAFVAFVGCQMAAHGQRLAYGDENFWSHVVPSFISVAALFFTAIFYERTDWKARSPKSIPWSRDLWLLAWNLDLTAEAPNGQSKPIEGRFLSTCLALAAAALLICYTPVYFPNEHLALVWSALALILAGLGCAFTAPSTGITALIFVAVSWPAAFVAVQSTSPLVAIATAVLLYGSALIGEPSIAKRFKALEAHTHPVIALILYLGAAAVASAHITVHNAPLTIVFAIVAFALVHVAAAAVLRKPAMALTATGLMLYAIGVWAGERPGAFTTPWHIAAWAAILAPVAAERAFALLRVGKPWIYAVHGAACVALALLATGYIPDVVTGDWRPLAWALAAAAALGYSVIAGAWLLAGTAFVMAILATGGFVLFSLNESFALLPLTLGYAAWLGYWLAMERSLVYWSVKVNQDVTTVHRAIAVAIVAAVAVAYPPAIPGVGGSGVALGWTAIAIAMYGLSLVFREPYYRYAGLAIFGLAAARVMLVVFLSNIDRLYKVIAAFILGVVLLAVSWGYFRAQGKQKSTTESTPPPPLPEDNPPTITEE